MAYFHVQPRYRALLTACGRASARAVLDWQGVIISGHPGRHVLRLAAGTEAFILKKEHRVPWRDRFASAWAGFGWVSRSVREERLLHQLAENGIPCPEVVASGEADGRAFVLLREEAGLDLREYLSRLHSAEECRALAQALGRELARIHAAGFAQPDLFAKHILVRTVAGGFRFCFLDWQRSRQLGRLSWEQRVRDLAALHASLAAELASDRLRLTCLRAYLHDAAAHGLSRRAIALAVRRLGERRLERRHTRELRQPPLPDGAQQLLWLEDDERLCIARDFYEELGGQLPSWLPQAPAPSPDGNYVEHRLILLGAGRTGHLVQRWSRAAAWMPRGKYPAPEMERAAALFRLQRFGVSGPRLLAMGHSQVSTWQRFSFLLTEAPVGPSLAAVMRRTVAPARRQTLLRELGRQLRQMHEAGYTLRPGVDLGEAWVAAPRLVLAGVDVLEATKTGWRDLGRGLLRSLALNPPMGFAMSRADVLRVLLGYLRRRRLDRETRLLLPRDLPPERRVA